MAQTIVLLILLAWLASTAIMTLTSGRPTRERPARRRATRKTPPPQTGTTPNPDFHDSALASRP